MSKTIIQGWEIDTNPHRISSDPPTTVRLHKLGESASTWFTPDELRRFAEALNVAAAEVEAEARS